MAERDYIERTIETVRIHRDADNSWPQWANIFADEIERLWSLEEQLEAALRERDEIGATLGEPCAECGHIDWRSDGCLDNLLHAGQDERTCTCTRDGEGFTEMRGCPEHGESA